MWTDKADLIEEGPLPPELPWQWSLIPVAPCPKPRMTQSDKWKKRPCVLRYLEFKDQLQEHRKDIGLHAKDLLCRGCEYHVIFFVPIPGTLSRPKRRNRVGRPHEIRPDSDNYNKAFLDAVFKEDKAVWDYRVSKIWWPFGCIGIGPIITNGPPVRMPGRGYQPGFLADGMWEAT